MSHVAANPAASLPEQHPLWAELKGAYRFLNNPAVKVEAIGEPHRRLTRRQAAGHPVVLCVQDDTSIDSACIQGGRWLMHSSLAVLPGGQVLGVLDQSIFPRVQRPEGETSRQSRQRWRESDAWIDAVKRVGSLGESTRLVHVGDRGADNLGLMLACQEQSRASGHAVDFVLRACRDRHVEDQTDRLWPLLAATPVRGEIGIQIGHQNEVKIKREGKTLRPQRQQREATLTVRFAPVTLCAPKKKGYPQKQLAVWAVYLKEEHPPAGAQAVEWMLLSSLPVTSLAEALTVVDYYRKRWTIEQWHRAMKEGCRLHESQLNEIDALQRLIAIFSVVAIRLLQLRDLANGPAIPPQQARLKLQQAVSPQMLKVIAVLARTTPDQLTPQLTWQTIARQGGWLARKHDGPPGWKTTWRGWRRILQLIEGFELATEGSRRSCG